MRVCGTVLGAQGDTWVARNMWRGKKRADDLRKYFQNLMVGLATPSGDTRLNVDRKALQVNTLRSSAASQSRASGQDDPGMRLLQ